MTNNPINKETATSVGLVKEHYDIFGFLHLLLKRETGIEDPHFSSGHCIYLDEIPNVKLSKFLDYLNKEFNINKELSFHLSESNKEQRAPELDILLDDDNEDNVEKNTTYTKFFIGTVNKKLIKITTTFSKDLKTEYILNYSSLFFINFTQEEQFKLLTYCNKTFVLDKTANKSRIFLILKSQNFYSRGFPIKKLKVNLDLFYGENFQKEVHKPLLKSLSDNKSGLYLIHGHKGTGKTSYLRHLTSLIDKPFYLVTKEFVPYLSDPSCLHFIISECANSIIIIEDAEELIKPRDDNHAHNATSLILNMGDGMLSDVVNCKFILTFNTDIKNIDDAITRAGRMKFQHEFKKLSPEYANKVAEHLKITNVNYTDETPLSDIFNHLDLENLSKISKPKKNKIGF
jgi:hypothetical protein